MSIAPDPKTDNNTDSDDGYDKAFAEFAAAREGNAAPSSEEPKEPGEPDGNDPSDEPAAPAEDEPPAATEEGEDDEPVTSGEAKGSEGGSQPPEEEQAPDPWAQVPEELKAEYAKVQKERDEALHKAKSDANRVAALSRRLQELSVAKPSADKAPDQPTEAQKALDEKIAQLREDYGDIADPLIELIENQRKELEGVRTVITGLNEAQQAQVIQAETQALEARHPDWREIAQSPDFAGWLQIQPPNIKSLAESWDARETSVVLTLFKTEAGVATGQKTEAEPKEQSEAEPKSKADAATGVRRSQQLDGGRDVRSRPAPAASEPPDDFEAAFKYFEERRKQKQLALR